LQLLKAKKGDGLKMSLNSNQSQTLDPQKAKKRYIILTYLEIFNMNEANTSGIKEEIEVDNDKTHYPLPLTLVDIKQMSCIKEQKISKASMR
jgi:hypothetical protein